MTSKEIQKVVQDTEKQLEQEKQDKAIAKIKEVVKKTLEALEKCKGDKDKIDKRIKYLRMDLDDLKAGKLDRIEERQAKDPEAKENTVIVIIKEKEVIREIHHHDNPWYWPYTITIQQPIWLDVHPIQPYHNTFSVAGDSGNLLAYNSTSNAALYNTATSINCSLAKDYSAGVYDIDGKIVNFR